MYNNKGSFNQNRKSNLPPPIKNKKYKSKPSGKN